LLSEHLATMALEKPIRERLVQRGRRLVRESLEVFEHWMETHKEVFSWIRPRFGVIALVKQTLGISSSDFAERVYRGKKVALVPCDTVFPDLTDYLRISYCHPPKKLAEALGRVSDEVTNVRAGRGEVVA